MGKDFFFEILEKMNPLQKLCPYGARCYRKNPAHFQEYRHPSINPNEEISPIEDAEPKESELQVIKQVFLYLYL